MPPTVTASRLRDPNELALIARQIRLDSLKMTYTAGSGHPGGSMSEAELLAALYYGGELRIDPKNPKDPKRDRFILSKGHCCPGLYSVLSQKGFFPREELAGFRRIGRMLQGHTDMKIPGVEMSAGSLGMGLSFANGCAMIARLEKRDSRNYVLLGDGECQEGQIWEAAQTSAHQKLDNVCAIVDYNKIQIEGFVKDIKNPEPFADKWEAFGWNAIEIDGHDFAAIFDALNEARSTKGMPTVIIAHTIKGKGVSFTEDKNEYHGRALNEDEMKRAMAELKEAWP
jgi:transketolase